MNRRELLASLSVLGCTAVPPSGPVTRRSSPSAIHIAGDSTAAEFEPGDPRVGWGAVLESELDGTRVNDAARSGRSSKSFLEEGHWAALLAQVSQGQLVLIQFGHNDQKPDPARATDAASTFRDFLRRYVTEARSRGSIPILLTPVSRRRFDGDSLEQSHGAYPDATRAVAAETGTPLIDLTEKTRALLERFGPDASTHLFAPDDNSHFSTRGARAVARLVIQGLRELGFEIRPRPPGGPALVSYPAAAAKRNRSAVVICPGGGYTHLSLEKEGSEVAAWLNELGCSAFVLSYRLAEHGHPAPLQDVLQAVRQLRAQADTLAFSPDRLGVLGFSAGGHVAACASCLFDDPLGKTDARWDQVSARPDFALLLYPVITLKAPHGHAGSRRALLGVNPDPALVEQLSLETRVTARTPATFLMHTRDDASVPVENSLLYQAALDRAGVANQLQLYDHGPHGIGLRPETEAGRDWPKACASWLASRGLLK